MWKQVLATAASASVLVAGIAAPGLGAVGLGGASSLTAAALTAGGSDERTGEVVPARSIRTAAQMLAARVETK